MELNINRFTASIEDRKIILNGQQTWNLFKTPYITVLKINNLRTINGSLATH